MAGQKGGQQAGENLDSQWLLFWKALPAVNHARSWAVIAFIAPLG
jgi:hypothetical protein